VLGVLAVLSTLIAGVGAWSDFVTLVRQVGDPITTPHNFTPGAVAYQLGLSEGSAGLVQGLNMVVVLGLVLWASLRSSPAVGYLTAATASQLLSPVLWDHYALLLLLPTAWLLDRRHWWAVAIPLVTAVFAIGLPPVVYPVAFWVALVAPIAIDARPDDRLRTQRPRPDPVISSDP